MSIFAIFEKIHVNQYFFNLINSIQMKNVFFVLILLFIISACGKDQNETANSDTSNKTTKKNQANQKDVDINENSLLGKWVNKNDQMGFDIQSGGKVTSINMATLDYNSWKLDGNKLIFNSTSKGVSNPVTTDEIYIVRRVTDKKMVIAPENNPKDRRVYEKQ